MALLARLALPPGLGKLLGYIGGAALVVALLWTLWARGDHYKGQRDRARHQITLEIDAHKLTKRNYRAAQAQAQEMETARLVRVTNDQQRITANVSSDYARRLADLRARFERMQRDEKARACAFGSTCGVAMPAVPDAASGIDGAPGSEEFSLKRRFVASAQAEQLDALITWVGQQVAVPVN